MSKTTSYINKAGVKVTVCAPNTPHKSERTWVQRGIIAQTGYRRAQQQGNAISVEPLIK